MKNIKIISWNIAGGHTVNSVDTKFDYADQDLNYFVKNIKELNADIVVIQENQTDPSKEEGSIAHTIAKECGYDYVFSSVASKSHIDKGLMLGTAIISKLPILSSETFNYQNPEFELKWADGRPAEQHGKNFQLIGVDGFYIANTQLLPLHYFGHSYESGEGFKLAQQHNELYKNLKTPLIFCGDFNFNNPAKVYSTLTDDLELKDLFDNTVTTRPHKDEFRQRTDHIFYSKEFSVIESRIIKTNTDHYLCFVEFSY